MPGSCTWLYLSGFPHFVCNNEEAGINPGGKPGDKARQTLLWWDLDHMQGVLHTPQQIIYSPCLLLYMHNVCNRCLPQVSIQCAQLLLNPVWMMASIKAVKVSYGTPTEYGCCPVLLFYIEMNLNGSSFLWVQAFWPLVEKQLFQEIASSEVPPTTANMKTFEAVPLFCHIYNVLAQHLVDCSWLLTWWLPT